MRGHLAVALGLSLCGCGGRSLIDYVTYEVALDPNCGAPAGSCQVQSCVHPKLEGNHVPVCSKINFATNPPTSGPHYPIWANFQNYDKPIPRGFYLHSEEHSAVVLLYNCARFHQPGTSCDAMVAAMKAYVAASPADPNCQPPIHNRIMIVPDPDLDAPFAAAAWGFALKGQCFDPALTTGFVNAHYGMNYENFCGPGIDPTDPSNAIPADCGK